jgi:plastocyanin
MLLARVVFLVAVAIATAAHAAEPGSVRGNLTVQTKKVFGGLKDADDRSGAVIYISGFQRAAPSRVVSLEQSGKQFQPRVLPVVIGQEVEFPNRDSIYHNVFSVSPLQSFDLGQHKADDPAPRQTFKNPGLIPVYCNIHPEMLAYIVVLENDAFAVTGKDGSFEIGNVPPGRLRIHAWMPAAKSVSQEIEVVSGKPVTVALTLQQTEKIEPHKRKDGNDYPANADASSY